MTATNDSSATIRSKIAEAEHRLETLRRARGQATLDGIRFDDRKIDRVQDELAALNDALPVAVARERAADKVASAARVRGLEAELEAAELKRLDEIAAADKAATELTAALPRIVAASLEVERLLRELRRELPAELTTTNLSRRITTYFAVKLAKHFPNRIFGLFVFNTSPLPSQDEMQRLERAGWSEVERNVARVLPDKVAA